MSCRISGKVQEREVQSVLEVWQIFSQVVDYCGNTIYNLA